MLIVLFLVVGILYTLSEQTGTRESNLPTVDFSTKEEIFVAADFEDLNDNRSDTISRLQEALAEDITLLAVSPSVEGEGNESEDAFDNEEKTSSYEIQKCPIAKDLSMLAASWPSNAIVSAQEGRRLVSYELEEEISLATSSATGTAPQTEIVSSAIPLISLPLAPAAVSTYCLDNNIIGVTAAGTLLNNTDAVVYMTAPAEVLIGYARDGHPIYGNHDGEVDECGGYQSATGYRYVVTDDSDTFIQCYRGVPQDFMNS